MGDMINFGGLWINKDKNGNEYFSGNFGYGGKILIFPNTFKKGEKDPDYKISICAKPDKNDKKEEGNPAPSGDDIPF